MSSVMSSSEMQLSPVQVLTMTSVVTVISELKPPLAMTSLSKTFLFGQVNSLSLSLLTTSSFSYGSMISPFLSKLLTHFVS